MTINIANKKWKCNKHDLSKLTKKGFHFNKEEGVYRYTFPLEFYNKQITLIGFITVHQEDGKVLVDVKTELGSMFSQFYNHNNHGYDKYLEQIDKQFLSKFKDFKINERKRKERTRRIGN